MQGHVFLVGFPRSGTTLLEKAISGHPQVATLQEIDHLASAGGQLLNSNAGLDRLATLSVETANFYRRSYWENVRNCMQHDISGKILVDKLPLHTLALPLIAKLFPKAKLLFALRDPRDVVLSCFRRRFQLNSAMFEFLTIEGAARYYDQVMTLASRYRILLPLKVHDVRHELLVASFEAEMSKVLAHMGLDWDPNVAHFADRARGVARTPSDIQLTRGLNADGVGQWRRYQPQLEPINDIIQRWVIDFGYDVSP